MDWFNELFDLAAVASGAGLLGGAAGTGLAMVFSGAIIRFVARTLLTAALTGAGFLGLLHYLGFEIVPPDDLEERINKIVNERDFGSLGGETDGTFAPEFLPGASLPAGQAAAKIEIDEPIYVVNSPFRRDRAQ